MTSIENPRPASTDGRYKSAVWTATLTASGAGLMFGFWQYDLPHSKLLLVGAVSAAIAAANLSRQAMNLRKPSLATAAAKVRAAAALLPSWTRPLLLPAPTRRVAPTPNVEQKAKPTRPRSIADNEASLNSERRASTEDERARRDGFGSDAASAGLGDQSLGNGATRGGFGTGTAAGAILVNLDAALGYAKHLIPSFKSDLESMFDETARKADRIAGTLSFGFKIVVLGALGYFLYIEAIEFKARAYKMWADACIARQTNDINHTSLNELLGGKTLDSDYDCASR